MAPEPSSVKLITAAYLEQSFETDQPTAASELPVPPGSVLSILLPIAKVTGRLVAGVAVMAITINLVTAASQERTEPRPACGVDWLLWASGSDQTFENIVSAKLEKSRLDLERQLAESQPEMQPFEIKDLNLNTLPWNSPRINPPLGKRK